MEEIELVQIERDGAPVLLISGAVDIYSCGMVRDHLRMLVHGPSLVLEVDLSGVRYLDSSGVSVLLSACAQLRKDSRTLVITGISEQVSRVFKILKLDAILKVSLKPLPISRKPLSTGGPRIRPGSGPSPQRSPIL